MLPVIYFIVFLNVEAPTILDQGTTSHVTVREGATVNITCNVSGVPPPRVSWYRRSSYNKHSAKEKIGNDGETLIIHNISRFCDDIYQCVAFNNIEPSASREIRVEVQFPPEIVLPNKRISQYQGKETIMECRISANPQAYSAWTRNGRTISAADPGITTPKYRTEIYEEMQYTITISLRILFIDGMDFGEYRCEAENKLGRDREEMILSELKVPTTQASTTELIKTTPRWIYRVDNVNRPQTTAPRVHHNGNGLRRPNGQQSFHHEPEYDNQETEGIQNQDKTGTKANKQKPPTFEKKRTPDMGVRTGAQEE
ncbi:hypothetical protein FSP39_021142 [Pinctada imbricata]|uniref:Ig-like domain-containing protein n=1 Tax=Pinctada imbricata TaxID=66713 RepID=A0AA88XTS0_PINIB|nr:hypothetical protein FSP39_021142 [Pinctada imbricata]